MARIRIVIECETNAHNVKRLIAEAFEAGNAEIGVTVSDSDPVEMYYPKVVEVVEVDE